MLGAAVGELVGAFVGLSVGRATQIFALEWHINVGWSQSLSTAQSLPMAQPRQVPPQSTSVSKPESKTPFEHVSPVGLGVVGEEDGEAVAVLVGEEVGADVGALVGAGEEPFVGEEVTGTMIGEFVGALVGELVGAEELGMT